jgi:HAD superfamily hydrolase (TIGR01549 family)
MIRTVFFDLDDTLVRSAPAWHSGVEAAFARLRERRPELGHKAIEAAWQSTNRALRMQLEAGMLIVAQVRALRWPATLKALGIRDDSLASDLETTLAETFIGGLQLFDDADVLDRLRCRLDTARPYHVGIITNGATDQALDSQYTKARRLGLLDRVDSFLASDAAGYRKPDPRIFALALERAGAAPHEALYVGDSIGYDVVGANRAGIVSVLLWRGHNPPLTLEGERHPAHVIASLANLDDILVA